MSKYIGELDEDRCGVNNEIIVQFNRDSSGIFLVNYSDSIISFFAYHDRPYVEKFAKDGNSNWQEIDSWIGCGTGLGNSYLPSCNYSYSEIRFKQTFHSVHPPFNTFSTTIKYCISVNGTNVCSTVIDNIVLEKYRFLKGNLYRYELQKWIEHTGFPNEFILNERLEKLISLEYASMKLK